MQTQFVGLGEIEAGQILQSFDRDDVAVMTKWANRIRQQGLDIYLSKSATQDRDTASWMSAGLIVLKSRTLGVEILLTKMKAVNGIAWQHDTCRTFIGNYAKDQWQEGATFRSLEAGLETIANLCPPTRVVVSGTVNQHAGVSGESVRFLDGVANGDRLRERESA